MSIFETVNVWKTWLDKHMVLDRSAGTLTIVLWHFNIFETIFVTRNYELQEVR